jgi:hypothetical protein
MFVRLTPRRGSPRIVADISQATDAGPVRWPGSEVAQRCGLISAAARGGDHARALGAAAAPGPEVSIPDRASEPGVAQTTALAILSHVLAGSLGDRMRTPALLYRALEQLIDPPFVIHLNPCHRDAAASRPLARETARLQGGRPPRTADLQPPRVVPHGMGASTGPALTAHYGRRPNRLRDGPIQPGGAG